MITVAMASIATSCKKEDDDSAARAWKAANEQAFNEVKNNPAYTEFPSPGNEGSVYYKVIKKGTGTKPIFYTSHIKFYAKGWFVADYKDFYITKGSVFQEWNAELGIPVLSNVSKMVPPYSVRGIQAVLQKMVEGDKWEVWVPYQLSSGAKQMTLRRHFGLNVSSGMTSTIPPYATLVFEIEVVKVL